jgi:two-component system NtrC family sensor kinase
MEDEPQVEQGALNHAESHYPATEVPRHPAHARASEELRFQALLESAPDAILIVDATGQIVITNGEAERLFGYDRRELIAQSLEVLLPEQLRAVHVAHRSAYAAAPRTRPMGSGLELRARRKDGSTFPVEISLSALPTDARVLVTSVIRDVTERKHTERALAQQTMQLQAQADLLELTHDTIMIRDWDGTITFWNHGAEEMYGWTRAEALGQRTHRLLQTHLPIPLADLEALLLREGRWEGELAQTRRDGTQVIVLCRKVVQYDPAGRPVAVFEINTDITEQKRATDELERQVVQRTAHLNALLQFSHELLGEHRLEVVLRRSMDHAMALVPEAHGSAVYLYDADQDRLVLHASVGFHQLPDISRPTNLGIIGSAFTSHRLQRTSSAAEWMMAVAQTNSDPQLLLDAFQFDEPPSGMVVVPLVAHHQAIGVLLLVRMSGTGSFTAQSGATLEGLANLTAAAIMEERSMRTASKLTHELVDLEARQRTLTERMTAAESAMLQAARLAAVGQLAASIAHEINNPLYAVRNSLYLLEEDLPSEMHDRPYLNIARSELARIAGIIERMREFYRPDRGNLAPCDINSLLEGTLTLAGMNMRYTAIQVIFTPAPDLSPVHGNSDQLRQVFLNLVLNAMDAMPHGGTLTVRTVAGPTVAVVEVQDTGIGMPAAVRERLFEPFFTNKPQGTGLGLSISAHIITQHGGHIEVESSEGQGSTFRVVLPYQPHS